MSGSFRQYEKKKLLLNKYEGGVLFMVQRKDVFDYVKNEFDIKPDYPWQKYSKFAALRHDSNGKWFGLLMNVTPDKVGIEGDEEIDVLNLKSPPDLNDSLTDETHIVPGYHMDKEHWISIILRRVDSINDIVSLINQSFELTK